MREICMEVANQLEASASGEDFEEDPPQRTPANHRFMAAVQEAVQSTEVMGLSSANDLPRCYTLHAAARCNRVASAPHILS